MSERRVAIVTDVAADLPPDETLKTQFEVGPIQQIPIDVVFKDQTYRPGVNLPNQCFQELLTKTRIIPKTAAMGPEYFRGVYSQLVDQGMNVISIHISGKISTTANSAQLAAQEFGSRVAVWDTGTVSLAQAIPAIEAEKAAANGASQKDILQLLPDIQRRTHLRAVTPNLVFLQESGRASHLQTTIGSLLQINPILQIDHDQIATLDKPRTPHGAIKWMLNDIIRRGELARIAIIDFEASGPANELQTQLIAAHVPASRIYRGELGPITGTHGGPGTWAVATLTIS